jgi:hypothetical protein
MQLSLFAMTTPPIHCALKPKGKWAKEVTDLELVVLYDVYVRDVEAIAEGMGVDHRAVKRRIIEARKSTLGHTNRNAITETDKEYRVAKQRAKEVCDFISTANDLQSKRAKK